MLVQPHTPHVSTGAEAGPFGHSHYNLLFSKECCISKAQTLEDLLSPLKTVGEENTLLCKMTKIS